MKYVLMTGATGGLGQPCVRYLADSSRYVVFAAGTNEQKLAELAKIKNVISIHMNISEPDSITAACRFIQKRCDRLDAIINLAGTTAFGSAIEGDPAGQAERLLQINVLGMIRVNHAFFSLLRQPGGRIINCSSEVGWMTAQPFATPYVLSKRAVEGYNDCLRRELMFLGVRVIKIQPGNFQTALTGQVIKDFQNTLEYTEHYHELLTRLKPLMLQELNHNPDPRKLARIIFKALEAKKPKIRYRVATGKLLLLLELLPETGVDLIYKHFFKFSNRK